MLNKRAETEYFAKILQYLQKADDNVISLTKNEWDIFNAGFRLYYFEKPDIVLENKETVYAIEHFEFDATNEIVKNNICVGSEFRIQENEFNKNHLIKNIIYESDVVQPVETKTSFKNYKTNFIRHYQKHVDKISEYTSNINKIFGKNKKVKYGFLVQDAYPYGSYIKEKDQIIQIVPIMDKDIFALCKSNKLIDFFIFINMDIENNPVIYLVNMEYLDDEIIVDINDKNFFNHKINNIIKTIKLHN